MMYPNRIGRYIKCSTAGEAYQRTQSFATHARYPDRKAEPNIRKGKYRRWALRWAKCHFTRSFLIPIYVCQKGSSAIFSN